MTLWGVGGGVGVRGRGHRLALPAILNIMRSLIVLALLLACSQAMAARQEYPESWDEPPQMQTMEYVRARSRSRVRPQPVKTVCSFFIAL